MDDWIKIIEDTALRIPELPPIPRKNLFDILGVENKELNNSRILAYFLNPKEEHGFGDLFFKALMKVIESKKGTHIPSINLENYNSDFKVKLEEQTNGAKEEENRQKKIDLFVVGEDWCIIIENKLYHHVANPLDVYWEHAGRWNQENRIGILLTLFPKTVDECFVNDSLSYINVTHQEWIESIQNNLKFESSINETDLLYLKEYLKTIESHYTNKMDEPKMNEIVNAIIQQRQNIKEIQKKVDESFEFIDRQINEVFESFGYEKEEHWFVNKECHTDLFFWVHPAENIVLDSSLWFCYEAWYTTRDNLDEQKIITYFDNLKINSKHITYGNERRFKNRFHIAKYDNKNLLNGSKNFKEKFTEILKTYYFNENGIVDSTIKFLTAREAIS